MLNLSEVVLVLVEAHLVVLLATEVVLVFVGDFGDFGDAEGLPRK